MPTAGEPFLEISISNAREGGRLFACSPWEEHHDRRTTLMLTGMTFLALAMAAWPQVGFAQSSSPLLGTWKLNLDKSKFSCTAFTSLTANYTQDGPNIKGTLQGTDAQGTGDSRLHAHL